MVPGALGCFVSVTLVNPSFPRPLPLSPANCGYARGHTIKETELLKQILRDDCVSAADVVRSIAKFVPSPIEFAIPEPTGLRAGIEWNLWRGMQLKALREAEAGAHLDALLVNAKDQAPTWWDWSGRTELPKLSEAARNDGHRILVSLTDYRDRIFEASRSQRTTQPLIRDERPGDSDRFERIGFIGVEIVSFLEKIGVPHSLDAYVRSEPQEAADGTGSTASTSPSLLTAATEADDATIGRSDDPTAQKIREAVRAVRLAKPLLANAPRSNRDLINASWDVFCGWAHEAERTARSPAAGVNLHLPILGYDYDKRAVRLDRERREPMDKTAFRKRIYPEARGDRERSRNTPA